MSEHDHAKPANPEATSDETLRDLEGSKKTGAKSDTTSGAVTDRTPSPDGQLDTGGAGEGDARRTGDPM